MISHVEPYHMMEGQIRLFNADWKDALATLPDNSVDVFVTDPPFFMPAQHYQSRQQWQRKWADTSVLSIFGQTFITSAVRVLKPTGHLITFCNHESYPVFYPIMYNAFDTCKALIWDKKHVGLGRVWRNQHEMIIAGRWQTSVFYEDGQLRPDVLSHSVTPSSQRMHPVEKPESLLLDLILPTTKTGDVVCDPFSGSGTTLLAAFKANRSVIGVELDADYHNIQIKRFQDHIAQGSLFLPEPAETPNQEMLWL